MFDAMATRLAPIAEHHQDCSLSSLLDNCRTCTYHASKNTTQQACRPFLQTLCNPFLYPAFCCNRLASVTC
jgi:hypothetical protein